MYQLSHLNLSYLYPLRVPARLSGALLASDNFAPGVALCCFCSPIRRMLTAAIPERVQAIYHCRTHSDFWSLCFLYKALLNHVLATDSLPGENQFLLFASGQWLGDVAGDWGNLTFGPMCYCKDGMFDPWAQLVGMVKNKSWVLLIIRSKGCFCFKRGNCIIYLPTNLLCLPVSSDGWLLMLHCLLASMPVLSGWLTCDCFVVLLVSFYIIVFKN